MPTLKHLIRHASIACAIFLLGIATGCSKPSDKPQSGASDATSSQHQSASKLGDLAQFQTIAADVAALVAKRDLPGAKTRIKDLETSWDSVEAGIKPRAAGDWHVVDKAIDHALEALRSSHPNQADCTNAMNNLLNVFASMKGHS